MANSTILILLSGGRGQWPNIWSVLAYQPDRVYVLCPVGDQRNYANLASWLDDRKVDWQALPPISPFDSVAAQAACNDIILRHPDDRVLINLTQAPKMMAIGASFACVVSGRANVCAFHRETSSDATHSAWGELPAPGPIKPSIEDYLAAYGRKCYPTFFAEQLPCNEKALSHLARNLAYQIEDFNPLLQILKNNENIGARQALRPAMIRSDDWRESWDSLLQRLCAAGFVRNVKSGSAGCSFELASTHAFNFLNGTWLELYARDEALKVVEPGAEQAFFADCAMGLALDGGEADKNELDLICTDGAGFLLYGSCKTGQKLTQDMLTEIVDRANLIGQAYCAKVFITSRPWREVDAVSGLVEQAQARGIPIISGEQLRNIGEHLRDAQTRARQHAR